MPLILQVSASVNRCLSRRCRAVVFRKLLSFDRIRVDRIRLNRTRGQINKGCKLGSGET